MLGVRETVRCILSYFHVFELLKSVSLTLLL